MRVDPASLQLRHNPAAASLSPTVAALVGYGRRTASQTPLDPSVAALVGYHRRRQQRVRLEWEQPPAPPATSAPSKPSLRDAISCVVS